VKAIGGVYYNWGKKKMEKRGEEAGFSGAPGRGVKGEKDRCRA